MRPLPTKDSKRREKEIYSLARFVANTPGCSATEIMVGAEAISASCRTSYYHYLTDASKWGWIECLGKTRGAVYIATPQFQHHVAMSTIHEPVSKRKKVGYNEEFLGSYIPNRSFYLSAAQREVLHASCKVGTFQAHDQKFTTEVRRFMADLTHNSSAFEGVDIQYADTISFLDKNIESRNMSPMDAAILRNHYNAIRYIVEYTNYPHQAGDMEISEHEIRQIHSCLSDGLLKDRRRQGQLRYESVEIKESCYIPSAQPDIIKKEFELLCKKAYAIEDPYEQAMFIQIHLPYLQPFDDCNKRTARLVCNVPLLNKGILPISWAEVNQRDYTDSLLCVYERNSTYGICEVFVEACKRSFERFQVSMKNREPSRMEISHSKQIAEAIRNRILHNDTSIPRDVEPIQVAEFELIVDEILEGIRENDMAAAPYRLRPGHIKEWLAKEKVVEKVVAGPVEIPTT